MSRTRVAIDLTPLLGRPTGVGVFATELLRHLVERADVDRPDPLGPLELVGFAVSWRGRGRLADLVPPGVRIARRPMAARPSARPGPGSSCHRSSCSPAPSTWCTAPTSSCRPPAGPPGW
ncbi:MAG: hypothetical protein R2755_33760 [Acidimicrobiales bacterium]